MLKKRIIALSLAALFAFVMLGRPAQSLAYNDHAASPEVHRFVQVCSFAPAGYAHCNAIRVLSNATSTVCDSSNVGGYHPCDLQSAYNLPSSTAGNGQTIAIVDPYDDPNA